MRMPLILVGVLLFEMTAAAGTIEVGPNILVSRESALPKIQMMVAANPKNARNLLGTAIAATPIQDVCTVYVSFDGGYSWKAVVPPGLPDTGSGDPQVAFADDGTAYFSTLGLVPDATKNLHFTDLLYRSRDGGLTWEKIATFGAGGYPDHDMAVTDNVGHLFISIGYSGANRSNIGIYRLDPGESSMRGPLHVATADQGEYLFTWNPEVFSDGTLFVPFEATSGSVNKSPRREVFASVSHDGGTTFSSMERIGFQMLDPNNPVNPYGSVTFAVDAGSTRFRDRLYMLWNDGESGGYHLKLAYSTDKGKTWSPPRDVDARPTQHANAFRPVAAVNAAGVVGISWLDTRDSATGRTYREYFTASLDGGDTFEVPVTVSSADSFLDAPANFALHPTIDSPRRPKDGSLEFSFDTTLGRAPDGGDFMGMAADSTGTFHPFWIDTRTGAFQVWTAAVRVGAPIPVTPPSDTQGELTKRLQTVFDPASYDVQTGVETIPVRFENITDEPICAPLIVMLLDPDTAPHPTPHLLNADNHKDWGGAYFDYSHTFRDLPCLAPGEITEAVSWHIRPLPSERTFVTMRISITHAVPVPEE